ncbi:MAG: 4'-phosphopantetheinyl transferase superfamily protein [Geodermatophilaceae bacterium]|nr:4'-phosphopantetheinyl transferase superfamily protein [Geodermatophilaceae bacterium]MDQ3454717.1 4'-phosphopantetheinyl transferase superfamily protein [Actinomycetota bacterium]
MIGGLLPASVVSEHAYDDSLQGRLYPEEEAAVARAVDKRRTEFRTTRSCARRALDRLGAPVGVIGTGHRGVPLWPERVVGSMTHCDGYRAAAVAWRSDVAALGVDAEPNDVLPDGVLDLVTVESERPHLATLPSAAGVCWDRLLFSAKESVFKAWYPVTRHELTFREAALEFDPTARTFLARLLVGGSPFGPELFGRWHCDRGLVVTAVVVPADADDRVNVR